MSYKSIPFRAFSAGLDLKSQPDALSEAHAIDCLNVEYTERGSVKQRSGYAKFTSTALTNQPDSLSPYYTVGGSKQLVAGNGNRLDVLGTDGAIVASGSTTGPTASPHYFTRFGGPTAEHIYVSNGTDNVRRWTGSAWQAHGSGFSFVTTTIDGRFLAIQTTDNRMVNARFNGNTAGNMASSVRFSDPGDPLTWGANNYVDLTPGDGEEITGICSWRELLFVFKSSKFFIFYGNSIDTDGEPVFNYRAVDSGVGLASPRALTVTDHGVYFLDKKGVYVTTGQDPKNVSDIIDPFFTGDTNIYFKSNALNQGSVTASAMTTFRERIYLSVPTGAATTNDRTLVFDPKHNWWTLWDMAGSALSSHTISSEAELVFGMPTGDNHVARYNPGAYTADNTTTGGTGGTAISSRWRSGWFDYGSPDVKRIREQKWWGSGAIEYRPTKDFEDAAARSTQVVLGASIADLWGDGTNASDLWGDGSSTADLWGPVEAIKGKLTSHGIVGTVFSVQFSNDILNAGWSVNRLHQHLADQKIPSTVAA